MLVYGLRSRRWKRRAIVIHPSGMSRAGNDGWIWDEMPIVRRVPVPEGRPENSPVFQHRVVQNKTIRPGGTTETSFLKDVAH